MKRAADVETARLVAAVDYSEALTITATEQDVRDACVTAAKYGFRAVVAFPQHLPILAEATAGTPVLAQIPVGFPCGGTTTWVKCREAEQGLQAGATDLDMVMNVSAFKAGDYARVADDIAQVLSVAKPFGVPFKVIVETGVLNDKEKAAAARLVADSGATHVKTCTGFGPGRATVHDIALLKDAVGDRIGIKASGGVASIEDGIALMRAGATVVALRRGLVDQLETVGWEGGRADG